MADLSTVGMIGLLVLLHIAGKALMAQLTSTRHNGLRSYSHLGTLMTDSE